MKPFLFSNAGIGTAGVILTCLIIVFPVIGTWLVAGIVLICALRHLMKAFDEAETQDDDTPAEAAGTDTPESDAEAPPFDVEAAMAEMAAHASHTRDDR